jgi:hypothetical protein
MTTVVGLFEDSRDAQRAPSALLDAGCSQESISLLASDGSNQYSRYLNQPVDAAVNEAADSATSEEATRLGTVFGALAGVLVGLTALAIAGIGPVLAAGPLVAALTGGTVGAVAGAATSSLASGLIETGVSESEAERYTAAVQRGGMLLVVEAADGRAASVRDIMREYGAHDSGSSRDASATTELAGQPEPSLDHTQQQGAVTAMTTASARATEGEPVPTDEPDHPESGYGSVIVSVQRS